MSLEGDALGTNVEAPDLDVRSTYLGNERWAPKSNRAERKRVNASGAPRPLRIAASGALIGALQHNGPRWPANRAAAYTAQGVASPEMLAAGFGATGPQCRPAFPVS